MLSIDSIRHSTYGRADRSRETALGARKGPRAVSVCWRGSFGHESRRPRHRAPWMSLSQNPDASIRSLWDTAVRTSLTTGQFPNQIVELRASGVAQQFELFWSRVLVAG